MTSTAGDKGVRFRPDAPAFVCGECGFRTARIASLIDTDGQEAGTVIVCLPCRERERVRVSTASTARRTTIRRPAPLPRQRSGPLSHGSAPGRGGRWTPSVPARLLADPTRFPSVACSKIRGRGLQRAGTTGTDRGFLTGIDPQHHFRALDRTRGAHRTLRGHDSGHRQFRTARPHRDQSGTAHDVTCIVGTQPYDIGYLGDRSRSIHGFIVGTHDRKPQCAIVGTGRTPVLPTSSQLSRS